MEDILELFDSMPWGDSASSSSADISMRSPPRTPPPSEGELPPTPGKTIDVDRLLMPTPVIRPRTSQLPAPQQQELSCVRKPTRPAKVCSGRTQRTREEPLYTPVTAGVSTAVTGQLPPGESQRKRVRSNRHKIAKPRSVQPAVAPPPVRSLERPKVRSVAEVQATTQQAAPVPPTQLTEKSYSLTTVRGDAFSMTFEELQEIPFEQIRLSKRKRYTVFLREGGRVRLKLVGPKFVWYNLQRYVFYYDT